MKNETLGLFNKIDRSLHPHLHSENFMGIEEIDPGVLLTPNRVDLLLKLVYARYRSTRANIDWHRKCYLRHIEVFNGFFEGDSVGKIGKESFIQEFDQLLDSIQNEGFDVTKSIVPVGRDNTIIDGAHRVVACIRAARKIRCAYFGVDANKYDSQWFKERGLAEKWLAAAGYVKSIVIFEMSVHMRLTCSGCIRFHVQSG